MNAIETVANKCIRGVLCGFDEDGEPLVDFPENSGHKPLSAWSVAPLNRTDIGRDVLLTFEDGDLARPVLIGVRQAPRSEQPQAEKTLNSSCDVERLEVNASREINLRCGKANISLRADGSVRIRGVEVTSRASGTNRVRGGNVQLN